jgi:hypothetical protein
MLAPAKRGNSLSEVSPVKPTSTITSPRIAAVAASDPRFCVLVTAPAHRY